MTDSICDHRKNVTIFRCIFRWKERSNFGLQHLKLKKGIEGMIDGQEIGQLIVGRRRETAAENKTKSYTFNLLLKK